MNNRLKVLRAETRLEPAGSRRPIGRQPPERQCDREGPLRPSLALAFTIAEVFGLAIEDIFVGEKWNRSMKTALACGGGVHPLRYCRAHASGDERNRGWSPKMAVSDTLHGRDPSARARATRSDPRPAVAALRLGRPDGHFAGAGYRVHLVQVNGFGGNRAGQESPMVRYCPLSGARSCPLYRGRGG